MKQLIVNKKMSDNIIDELGCMFIVFLEVIAFIIIGYFSINVAFSGELETDGSASQGNKTESNWPRSNWTENQYREMTLDEVTSGSLLYKTDAVGRYLAAATMSTDVDIKITGMIARTTVTQEFKNDSDQWLEGLYVFPLPEDSAVDHLKMIIGERIIEGKIKPRKEARKIYNNAKRSGKKASLIEQQRPNMFQNSIANIAPHEVVKVVIEYQQKIHYLVSNNNVGEFSLRFPMTITPRYIPGRALKKSLNENIEVGNGWAMNTNQVPDASLITPPVSVKKINPINLRVELDAGFPIESIRSAYHRVSKVSHGEGKATITLLANDESERINYADRDFSLTWKTEVGKHPRAAVFSQKKDDDFYHLLMIMPPNKIIDEKARLNREVVYILDTSGSMGGASIRQARKALLLAIDKLSPRESFNVIEFNSTATKLFSNAVIASPRNKNKARRFVKNLNANGGTEMASALNLAFEKREYESANKTNKLRQIIFLTDGSVGNEDMLFALIKQKLGNSRLFTIGIGSAPNSHFMTKAAKFGRGTFTYIGDVNEVQLKMAGLFAKLDSPVLKNIRIDYGNSEEIETWPKQQPDLYLGEPITIVTRSKEALDKIKLSALMGSQKWMLALNVNNAENNDAVAVLWARSKISNLMDSEHEGASKEQIKKSVTEVALKHHLVSKFTSLVAVDITPSRTSESKLKKHLFKTNLPKGSSHKKIFGRLAQTATTAELNILTGLILLLIALVMIRHQLKLNTPEKNLKEKQLKEKQSLTMKEAL